MTFNFSITYRSPALFGNHYSAYQLLLYETITEERDKEKTFDQIADWLNKEGYLSIRGKKFRGAHVHSIVKKKKMRDEKLDKKYPQVRSDFKTDVFDKRLINVVDR